MKSSVRPRKRPAPPAPETALPPTTLTGTRNSMRLAELPIDQLHPPARNVRRYNKRQMTALKASVARWGVVRPVLVGLDGMIVAGVAIWLAAKELGLKSIPVVYAEHLTNDELRLYRIADQKLSTLGEYDEDALRLEFLELGELSLNLDLKLDLDHTGFLSRERDAIVLKEDRDESEPDETIVVPRIPVTRLKDLWRVGAHYVYCGNSLDGASYEAVLQGELAQMVVCDGPYNVPIRGHVSSRADAREFSHASGEMSGEEFIAFQRTIFEHLVRHSIDGSIHYHWISWHFMCELLTAGRAEYTELKNVLTWIKQSASRGFYRSQTEFCAVFKNGRAPHICTFALEEGARWRSNALMGYAGCNSFGPNRDRDLADHPTIKNTSCIADLLRDCSSLNGLILDAFGGAGTLILAAELTHRRARLIEIDPIYVDVTIRRARERCGLEAVLAATGQTFEEVALERLGAEALADTVLGDDLDEDEDDPDEADMEWFKAGAADLDRDGDAGND